MVGRMFYKLKIYFPVLLLLCLPGAVGGGEKHRWVAVLLSDNAVVYDSVVSSFIDGVAMNVKTFNLHGDIRHDPNLEERLLAGSPSLIFTLGAKAAYAAKLWTKERQDIPVLFAMVINWKKYGLTDGQSNMVGISSEVNPGNQFLYLSLFAPQVKRVGVIYSNEYSREIVKQATDAVRMLELDLVERKIDKSEDFRRIYRQLAPFVDGLWILNDPITYTTDNMSWMEKRCIVDKLVCIGQSKNLAVTGLMLSVRPDVSNIGTQAASMAKNIVTRGQEPVEIGVMEPLGTNIYVNSKTALRVGVQLSERVLNMATEVVE